MTTTTSASTSPTRGSAPGGAVGPRGSGEGQGTDAAVFLRRRLVAVGILVVLVTVLAIVVGRAGAQAELADPVAGHVVVQPGETLWDVAAATAPDGVDVRAHLADLRALNGIDGDLDAWAVVLLPAR